MKNYSLWIKPRGSEYKFSSPRQVWINAFTAKEARRKVIDRVGDVYKIVKCVEVK